MYSPWPFAIAQGNVELPYLVAQTLIYSCIVYWMVGGVLDGGWCTGWWVV